MQKLCGSPTKRYSKKQILYQLKNYLWAREKYTRCVNSVIDIKEVIAPIFSVIFKMNLLYESRYKMIMLRTCVE